MLEFESALARAEALQASCRPRAADGDRRRLPRGAVRPRRAARAGSSCRQPRGAARPGSARTSRRRGGRQRTPGCDEPGRDRHRRDAHLTTRARSHQRRARSRCGQPRGARRGASLDADGRPYPPPAGRARDVRLQGGRLARGRAGGATQARAGAYRAAGGAARRCGRDARRARGAWARRCYVSLAAELELDEPRAAMAHEPDTSRRARWSARHVCVGAREDRPRSRAARADGGGGGAGADGRRIVHDAPEAQPRTVGARAGVRASW